MARRSIVVWPEPVLGEEAAEVADFGDELAALVEDLVDTCADAGGVGLAAPQIGVPLRVCLVDLSGGEDPDERALLVNPRIVARSGAETGEEGCLSLPGLYTTVERSRRITVEAADPSGGHRTIEAEGMLARVMAHEIDHLDGIMILDRVRGLKRQRLLKRIRKARAAGTWPDTA